jgi:hypothetical protein
MAEKTRWLSPVPMVDDFGDPIVDTFIDGKTRQGPWGIMTAKSFARHGYRRLGTGYGQKYVKQADGKWLCVEGSSYDSAGNKVKD